MPVFTVMVKLSVSVSRSSSVTVYVMAWVPAVVGVPVSWRVLALNVNPGTLGERLYARVPLPPLASGSVNASIAVPTV